jgi:hypothetical protein
MDGFDIDMVGPYHPRMALPSIKSTYTLDVSTVRALEELAVRWNVSKSEALRRAIRSASGKASASAQEALASLDRLQQSLALTRGQAVAWARRARAERRGASARRLARAR